MEATAVSKNVRVSPYKAQLVANEIRGYSLPEAIDVLKAMPMRASKLILKTLFSVGANAKYKNPDILEDSLYVKKICIDVGPMFKRFRPRARGRASRIRKRTSSIMIILSDEN